jgi:hypothetical protein
MADANGNTPADDVAAFRQMMATMATEMAQLRTERDAARLANRDSRSARESTVESAFGGTNFRPVGMAAWVAFLPVSTPVDAHNPAYKDRAKTRGEHPGMFKGDKTKFDNWLRKLADKFEEDVTTFRSEKSRMRYVMLQLEGDAEGSIETRYQSEGRPFSGVAEMIQALETAYHDPNQASIARKELEAHRFKPSNDADVHAFISRFNKLAQQSKLAESEWSQVLWEHMDVNLGSEIFEASTNPSFNYEVFCEKIAKAVYNNQYAFSRRQKNAAARPAEAKTTRKTTTQKKATATTAPSGKKLSESEKQVHWDNDTCFGCGKKGHRVIDCPEKKVSGIKPAETEGEAGETSCSSESENE